MLTVESVLTTYGAVRALDGVSLEAAPASITAVLGANGAGKTTLLRTISGVLHPRRGRILVAGEDVTGLAAEKLVRRGVAHVPEGRGVITELTVEENLRLGALWRRDRAPGDLDEVYAIFPQLRARRRSSASALSGGERQMLALGRALLSRPRLLLLDEPSLGLAPRVTAEIMALIQQLRQDRGLTVLLVEQNAQGALGIADRAVVLNLGRVAVSAPAADLAADDRLRHHYLGF